MLSRVVGAVPGAATAGLRRFSSSPAAAAKVGFIGLGNMGKHMAVNLVKAGHTLSVFDLAEGPVSELVSAGAAKADSAAAAVEGADAVVTMLPSSPHVKDVYLSSVFPAAAEGTLCIDCSTIDPNTTRELAGAAQEAKVRMVDAPVSGGVGGAEAGTLTFMVGGSEVDFASASELLVSMGKNLVHCGGAGNGQVAKICNNLVLGISMNAVSEAMNLGVQLGIDPHTLAGIINTSSGRCWSSDTYNPHPGVLPGVPSSRDYEGGFGTDLMLKDMGLAADAAKSVKAPLPTGAAATAIYTAMSQHGLGRKDFSAVYKFLQGNK